MWPLPKFHTWAILVIMYFCTLFAVVETFIWPHINFAGSTSSSGCTINVIESKVETVTTTSYEFPVEVLESQEVKVNNDETERNAQEELKLKFDDKKFTTSFVKSQPIEVLRSAVFDSIRKGELRISTHKGGKKLNYEDAKATVVYVLSRLPNIPKTPEMVDLILETMMTETHFGNANYTKAAKRFANYGLVQIRKDTAEDTLKWLGWVRTDVKTAVLSFYDKKLSLQDNLLYNVPFSIAMCAQIYWRKVPDLSSNMNTVVDRAIMWKVAYNSSLGEGTVNAYLERVNYMPEFL